MAKQAICLITRGDLTRIKKFIEQFENHPDINIYIHYDAATVPDLKKELIEYNNVRSVISIRRTARFSPDLIKAELDLYYEAYKDDIENATFHLFSESCYLLASPSYFVDYFTKYKEFDFITYGHYDPRLATVNLYNGINEYINKKFNLQSEFLAKAHQWKSLSRSTVESLIFKHSETFTEILNNNHYFDKTQAKGALDEFIIPTIIFHCIGDKSVSCKRYINWFNTDGSHPNVLKYSEYENPAQRKYKGYIDIAVLQQLIVRKIDCLDDDSVKFLEIFRQKFNAIEAKLREINKI